MYKRDGTPDPQNVFCISFSSANVLAVSMRSIETQKAVMFSQPRADEFGDLEDGDKDLEDLLAEADRQASQGPESTSETAMEH